MIALAQKGINIGESLEIATICAYRNACHRLQNGTMRFCDIQKTIGDISQRMLTVTLRSLETDGLIVRKVYAEVPPRVEYNLTEIGCSLMPHIESLVGWALEHMNDILNRRSLQN